MLIRESEVIKILREAFPDWGLGDDAAVLGAPDGDLLFATDAVVEGVHFGLGVSTLSQAVQKGITSNVSDIYAMGGIPSSIAFTAGLAADCGYDEIAQIVDGLKKGCSIYGITLSGGDTVFSPAGYFFNVAIVGHVPKGEAVTRGGAQEGDTLVLFGDVGGSLAGMRLLEISRGAGERGDPLARLLPRGAGMEDRFLSAARRLATGCGPDEIRGICVDEGIGERSAGALSLAARHLVPYAARPSWLLDAAPRPEVTAMIDISDGLSRDLFSLCAESGRGAVVRESRLPVPFPLEELDDRRLLLELSLSSGEEYRLLAAVPEPDRAALPSGAAILGETASSAAGLMLMDASGATSVFPRLGYEHVFPGRAPKKGR